MIQQRQEENENDNYEHHQDEDLETLEEQTRIQLLSKGNYICKQKTQNTPNEEPQYQQVLQMKNEITENAQKISAMIKTIPQYKKHFQPIIEQEEVQLGKLTEDNIEECEEQNPIPKKMTSQFVSLKMHYYAKTWQQQMLEIKQTYPKKTLQLFIQSTQNMIEMLKYLQNKGIIHFNIHTKTMLASSIRAIPILSNFNLSFQIEELKKEETENLFPNYEEYAPWPIEVYLASQLSNIKEQTNQWKTQLVEQEALNNWINTFTESPIFKRLASEERRELLKIQLTQYFHPILQKPLNTMYENLIQSAKTWDTYSICILLLDTFILLELHENINQKFIRDFVELLKTIIYANPNARPSIEYLENALTEIFTHVPKEEYAKFTANQMLQPNM
jgi:hypothetical protein